MPFCPANKKGQGTATGKGSKGRGRGHGRTTAKEVELETDDDSNNLMPLQPKSPLQQNPKEVNCLLHIVCITYSLIFVYYQLVCLEKMATAVRHRKLN